MSLNTRIMRSLIVFVLLFAVPPLALGEEASEAHDEGSAELPGQSEERSSATYDGEVQTAAVMSSVEHDESDEVDSASEEVSVPIDTAQPESGNEANELVEPEHSVEQRPTPPETDSPDPAHEPTESIDEEEGDGESETGDESHSSSPRRVLSLGDVELSLDFKLFAHYEIDVASPEVDNGFYISRAYLGFRLRFTPWLAGRVTYDVSQVTDLGRSGEAPIVGEEAVVDGSRLQGSMVGRLKYAYIDFGIERLSMNVRAGIVQTPFIDWMEHIELTRFLRKVMFENEYHYPSADFGLALIGDIGDYVSYHLGLYNGEGYHGLEDARFKDVIGRVSLRPAPSSGALSGLALSGYFQVEFPLRSSEDADTHRRFGGAITYRLADEITSTDTTHVHGEIFALWVQAFFGQEGQPEELENSWGISSGVRGELPYRLFLLGRLDHFDPDLEIEDDNLWTVLGAFGFHVARGVTLALDYQSRLGPGRNTHVVALHVEMVL